MPRLTVRGPDSPADQTAFSETLKSPSSLCRSLTNVRFTVRITDSIWTSRYVQRGRETQDSFALSRNGFQESASRLASSKCPSSKSLPTHLKYSQRNDASGNWYTCSFGTHKSNFLSEINADRIAGLRSRTLSGHPDDAVRTLMLSERLRNLEPRLRSSEAFLSSDFRFNHSNETPITIPVKKTNANLNQRCWPSARTLL